MDYVNHAKNELQHFKVYIYIYSYIKMSKNKPAKYDQDLSEE